MNTLNGDELRWPAEWEAQEAVWISWPHREDLWCGGLTDLVSCYARLVAEISPYAEVRINAAAALHPAIEAALRAHPCRYTLYDHATNDVWCRDHGGIFVHRSDGKLQIADWTFNAWGGKFPPWDQDNEIPRRMAESLNLPRLSSSVILEGGAIEGNGAGLVLTTEAVLLNANRNPHLTRAEIESEMHRLLGTKKVFWLGKGIEGDDTDGHIDDMVRFVHAEAVVSITEADSRSPHYRNLAENNERLQDLRTLDGHKVEVVPLPMPRPEIRHNWRLEQLPASYANFLICNGCVIVPIFMQEKEDDRALGILRECFPGKQVIGLDARAFILEGGAIHCITQQQPKMSGAK